jgi:hypothetical protein
LNDDEKSFFYADSALLIAQQEKYPEGIAMANYCKGNCLYVLNNYGDALSNQLSALRIYDSLENLSEKGHLLTQIASIQSYTGSYELAINNYEKAIETFENICDTASILKIMEYLGNSYLVHKDTISAIEIFMKRLSLAEKTGNIWELPVNYESLGRCYSGRIIDSALLYYDKAGSLWDELSDEFKGQYSREKYFLLIAEAYYAAGPQYYMEAEEFYEKSYNEVMLGTKQLVVRLMYGRAEYYYALRSYEEALYYLDRSYYLCSSYLPKLDFVLYTSLNEKLEDEIYLKSYMEKIYRLYYLIHTDLQHKDLAFDYYQKASEWKDSIYNEQNRRQWAMLQGQYETERAQSKINVLETENEVNELKIRQSRFYLFAMGGFVLVLALIGIMFYRQNKIKLEHKTLVVEQKLFRVQMNPHFMFNALAGLQVYIWNKDPVTANEYLASFSRLLRLILENSREEFVPVEKEIDAITHYLKLQSYLNKDKFDFQVNVDDEIDEESMLIPPMLAQPFIENSIEHGILPKDSKGHIDVTFRLLKDVIHIEIEDDGIGFEAASELKKKSSKEHKSLAMKITKDRLMMMCKKYNKKYTFLSADTLDAENNVSGAKVSFDVPYSMI